jgi:UDP-N-acetylmuramoylalanine--D-glutamate ligase
VKVSIIGLGASGVAAARLARTRGGEVYVSDLRSDHEAASAAGELRALGAHVDLGRHDLDRIATADTVIVSPGIPPEAPVLQELRARGIAWISEPEFAVRFYQGSLIAVTGTNGKTTTAALAAHLLQASGVDAALGGNVGGGLAPAASALALREPPPAWYVLEVSSFQLADTVSFSPDVGVVTTLAPDHLDRYPSVEAYYRDKAHLFRNAEEGSRWVLNGEDAAVRDLPADAPGERYLFALDPSAGAADPRDGEMGACAFLRNGVLALRLPGEEEEPLLPAAALPVLGRHNVMNALAAALTARLAGAGTEGIRTGLTSFRPLPHRMEPVGDRDGVLWVNDSKATNVHAALNALASLDRPVVALLGGKDKGEDFRPLASALAGRARVAVLFGEAASRLRDELAAAFAGKDGMEGSVVHEGGDAPLRGAAGPELVEVREGFDAAVDAAHRRSRPGDLLLLSPACSSFDLFPNYEARGRRFAELARGEVPG